MEQDTNREIEQLQQKIKSLREQSNNSLDLQSTNKQDLKIGTRKNGRLYSVRLNRMRFFYPNEWIKFYECLRESQKFTFDCLINTGARVNEMIHVKAGDVDTERNTIILRVTKVKAKKGEKNPKPRTIRITKKFTNKLNKYIKKNKLMNDDYLGLLSKPAIHLALKKALQKAEIKDWWMFSTHNIRKTYGNWLNALGVDSVEVCKRMGHDINTFLRAYGSPDIFSYEDLQLMKMILGDVNAR